MEIRELELEGNKVISLIGSLDALSAGDVEKYFVQEADLQGGRVIMNLEEVDFMSSAGLRAIMAVAKNLRQAGGDLRLAAAQPGVEKMLKISGFTSILKTYPNLGAANDSFKSGMD